MQEVLYLPADSECPLTDIVQFDTYMDFLNARTEDYRNLIVESMRVNIQRRRNITVAAVPFAPPPPMVVVDEEAEILEMRARLEAPRQSSGTGGLTVNVDSAFPCSASSTMCPPADIMCPPADVMRPPIVIHEDDIDEEVRSALGSVSLVGYADDDDVSSEVTVRPPQSAPRQSPSRPPRQSPSRPSSPRPSSARPSSPRLCSTRQSPSLPSSQGIGGPSSRLTEGSVRLAESINALLPSSMNEAFCVSSEALEEATEIDWY